MARTVPIGEQDFGDLLRDGCFYVDKTRFIKEWWENRDKVTLITRPRRFGKTLTMSMLDYFFSLKYAGGGSLFEGLFIWEDESCRKLQGSFPVIFLSFAGVKADNYKEAYYDLCSLIAREYRKHAYLLDSSSFLPSDKKQFEKILNGDGNARDICVALNLLSEYLYGHYGKKVIILLDEYDTPMQEAYVNGYWDEMALWLRGFFHASFKTNPYLERGLMTGITRISKESVFSDLNNLSVVTTTSRMYETSFGFTEDEVFHALEEFGLEREKQSVREWYDGFRFGTKDSIYNPWSVINYLKFRELKPYWANTSSNALVSRLIQKGSKKIKTAMEQMLLGQSFQTSLDEEMVFQQLDEKESAVWSLLLASGYLKAVCSKSNQRGKTDVLLKLTNLEVTFIFEDMFLGWFTRDELDIGSFSDELALGDKDFMNAYLNEMMYRTLSYYDTGKEFSKSGVHESFYHGLVLGLVADLRGRYVITSNKESGLGRYDVMLKARNGKDGGIILEFKVLDSDKEDSLQDTVKKALRQIVDKGYAAMLQEEGIDMEQIRIYGFAFSGKSALIDGGCILDQNV